MSAEVEVLAVGERTLSELAEEANNEHALAIQGARTTVEHAIRAGEALIAARRLCAHGEWLPWVDHNFSATQETASCYMRLAVYREIVLDLGHASVKEAQIYLRGLPPVTRKGSNVGDGGHGEPLREEARALFAAGATKAEISRVLGVDSNVIKYWVDPEYAERQRQANHERSQTRRARAAEERERRLQAKSRAAARKAGGAIAEAYSMAERMQDVIGRAQREATDSSAKLHLSQAGTHYRKMRDEIVRALGVS